MISQIVAGTALAVFARTAENSAETYYNYTIFLTGLTGILAMIPALYFYRRDKVRRIASGLIPAQKKVPLSISETVLLLLAGGILYRSLSYTIRPLLQLKDAAAAISEGNYQVRVDDSRKDEIGQLAKSFNYAI